MSVKRWPQASEKRGGMNSGWQALSAGCFPQPGHTSCFPWPLCHIWHLLCQQFISQRRRYDVVTAYCCVRTCDLISLRPLDSCFVLAPLDWLIVNWCDDGLSSLKYYTGGIKWFCGKMSQTPTEKLNNCNHHPKIHHIVRMSLCPHCFYII